MALRDKTGESFEFKGSLSNTAADETSWRPELGQKELEKDTRKSLWTADVFLIWDVVVALWGEDNAQFIVCFSHSLLRNVMLVDA